MLPRSLAPHLAGAASLGLLGASFVWAHHWGVRADALVAAWAGATLAATAAGLRTHSRFALACVVVSVLALLGAGLAWAAGADVAGACGGG
jgi:hypothetical protein